MAAANGEKGFEVPELDIKFTKLFINGQFVDAVSGTHLFPSTLQQISFSTDAGRSIFFLGKTFITEPMFLFFFYKVL